MAVVSTTETIRSFPDLFLSKVNSSDACDMLSKPMKAQGEITAIPITWERADVSSVNTGLTPLIPPKRDVRKHMAIPTVKTDASMIMQVSTAFL